MLACASRRSSDADANMRRQGQQNAPVRCRGVREGWLGVYSRAPTRLVLVPPAHRAARAGEPRRRQSRRTRRGAEEEARLATAARHIDAQAALAVGARRARLRQLTTGAFDAGAAAVDIRDLTAEPLRAATRLHAVRAAAFGRHARRAGAHRRRTQLGVLIADQPGATDHPAKRGLRGVAVLALA